MRKILLHFLVALGGVMMIAANASAQCTGNVELGVDQVINPGFENFDSTEWTYFTDFEYDTSKYCVFKGGGTATETGTFYSNAPHYCDPNAGWSGPSEVFIGPDASYINGTFPTTPAIGGTNYYMIDGSDVIPNTFWQQEVYVEANQWYYFEMSAITLHTTTATDLANFGFYLDGSSFSPVFTVPGTAGVWDTYIDSIYYTGPSGWVDLEIRNEVGGNFGSGNDWGIDEVHFTPGCRFGSPGPQPDLVESITLCGTTGSLSLQDFGLDCTDPTLDFTWSTGETTCQITISAATAPVTLCVSQSGSCVKSSATAVVDFYTVDIGADADLCNPISHTFSASLSDNHSGNFVSYKWYYNGTEITGETASTLTASDPGEYVVEVEDASCGIQYDTATVTMSAPVPLDGYFCAPPAASTIVGVIDAGGTYDWYAAATGGSVLAAGDSTAFYTTPPLLANTTYYVEDSRSLFSTTGPTNKAQANDSWNDDTDRFGAEVEFTVFDELTINSVAVKPQSWETPCTAGNVNFTFSVRTDPGGVLVDSYVGSVNCGSASFQTMPVDFEDLPAGDYTLDCGGCGFFYSTTTNWPTQVPDIIRITNDDDDPNNTGYFFDWDITYTQPCERTPVDAILVCCPDAPTSNTLSPSGTITVCPGATTTITATAAGPIGYNYRLYRNGAPYAGPQASNSFDVTLTGTYFIRAHDPSDLTCFLDSDPLTIQNFSASVDLGPDELLCSPAYTVLDAGVDGVSYAWLKDGAPYPGSGQTLFVNESGTYIVEKTTACETLRDTVVITINGSALIPTNVVFCPAPSNETLTISGGVGPFNWYDAAVGGGLAGVGTSLPITANGDTTLWVEDQASAVATVITTEPASLWNGGAGRDAQFVATTSIVLNTVDIRRGAGCTYGACDQNVTFQIFDVTTTTVVGTYVHDFDPGGIQNYTMPIGASLIAGHQYNFQMLTTTSPEPERTAYATGSFSDANINVSYTGAFFNWNYSYGSPCDRTPVQAIEDCPVACTAPTTANIAGGPFNLCAPATQNLTVTTDAAAGYLYTWYRNGAIVAGPTADDNAYTATSSGTYKVRIADPANPASPTCWLESNDVVVTINPIPAITTDYTDPTTCSGTDGTITIEGLNNNETYQVDFDSAGVGITRNYTSNGSGEILISGLDARTYSNIQVTLNSCPSNLESETLTDPVPPVISTTKTDPTTCLGTDGSITISGLDNSTPYVINYDSAGISVSRNLTSTGSGQIVITGLNAVAYTNIIATAYNCPSNAEAETLVDPNPPVIGSAAVSPTTCGGSDGVIVITGLDASTPYVINYDSAGFPRSRSLISTGAGEIVITGLNSVTYNNIIATLNGCPSNSRSHTLVDPTPPVITTTKTDPTTCGGSDGTITISGLANGVPYSITYDSAGVASSRTLTSNGSGQIVITGLNSVAYTNIRATRNNCVSNAETETLVDPTPPVITSSKTDPTTCSGTDGTITLSGLANSTPYVISYDSAGNSVTRNLTSTGAGQVVITGLNSVAYINIVATASGCPSNAVAETLVDPATPSITTVHTDPTTCGGTDGSITISNLANNTAYVVDYDSLGVSVSRNMTSNGTGEIVLNNLNEGTYANIQVTVNGCPSNVRMELLADPTPPNITVSSSNPTTCGGSDGTITLGGLLNNTAYVVDYDSAGITVSRNLTSNGTGQVIITGLNAASYTNITVTIDNCESNAVTATLSDPTPPTITSAKSDPTTCSGTDGTITLSGLLSTTAYVINYDSAGVSVSRNLTSNGTGQVIITGLNAASYTNITATINNCPSNTQTETLVDPTPPTITSSKSDPTTCNGTDGTITLSGLLNTTAYVIDYDSAGVSVSRNLTSNGSGQVIITGLNAASYTNITASINNCPSNTQAETLVDPTPPTITSAKSDPTTCNGTDGTITLSGLLNGTAYVIDYDSAGVAVSRTITSNGSGQVIITGLNEGTYANITASLAGCPSNSVAETLNDPTPPTITTSKTDPTGCGTDDGTITVSGLANGVSYVINYDSAGVSVSRTLTSNGSGQVVLTGLSAVSYTNITASANNCPSNSGSETLVEPTPPVITSTSSNPTTCGGSDGTITISGLANTTAYVVNYDSAGIAVSRNLTSNGSGQIVITGLNDGTYANITVSSNGCVSNSVSETLTEPTPPAITSAKTDPTTCGGSDGTITISGLGNNLPYTFSYDSAGVAVTRNVTSDGSGNAVITGLNSTTYANITVTVANCISNAVSETLVDPTPPAITSTKTDPTSCGGSDGTITLSGLLNNTAYVVTYDSAGIASTRNLTSNGTGNIVITGLNSVSYTNIIASLAGCPSNPENQTLSDPGTPAITTTKTDPTTCGGTDGTITISGLANTTLYVIDYDSAGVAVSRSLTSNGSGQIVLTGLNEATYSNITATLAGCISNAETQTLADPTPPVITSTKSDPTTCSGTDGTITISNLANNTAYVINYDSAGVAVSRNLTSDGTGNIVITGLNSVSYTNITATLLGCVSNSENQTLVDPTPPTITTAKTDPTTCGGTDGTITVSGLLNSTAYLISYDSAGVAVSRNLTSDGSGNAVITGLPEGTYANITATINGCPSNTSSETLVDPTPPSITSSKTDPTTCSGTDGTITLSGLLNNTAYLISYDSAGVSVTRNLTSNGTGQVVITGLNAVNYTNIMVTINGCDSNNESQSLVDPTPPVITTAKSDPTTCGGTDGTITISGLLVNTSYVIDYDSAGVSVSRTLTSDGAGNAVITGLVEASYTNITATINGCPSNTESETLVDPTPPVITSAKSDPTTCSGTDGFITLSGLLNNTAYLVNYDSAGVSVSRNLTSDGSGNVVITGLGDGVYNNIIVTINGCPSNAVAETLVEPTPETITTTKSDPTSCGGADGTITISGLTASTSYVINYDSAGIASTRTLTTDLSGDIVLTGLNSVSYTNITATADGCTTNAETQTLSDPGTPSITTVKTDPTTCGGTDGTITISGLAFNVTYVIDYDSAGVAVSRSMTSDGAGNILISGLNEGTYANITATLAGCTSNAEAETLVDPTSVTISTSKTDPTTCGGDEGTITIIGLDNNTAYVVNYDSAGVSVSRNLTSDGTGQIIITGLNEGTYANISVTENGCTSNTESQTLTDPTSPSITTSKTDPTTCGGSEGTITVSGLVASTTYLISYDSAGVSVSRTLNTNLAGDAIITGLNEGTYANITATLNNCPSNTESETLVDPTPPSITSAKADPTSCGGSEGSITISGLTASTTYLVSYDSAGVSVSRTLDSDLAGDVVITGLNEGTYSNIRVSENGCTSNTVTETLVDPTPPSITTAKVDPTSCGGNEGTITISGLLNATSYLVDYDSAGVASSRTLTSNGSGEIVLTGLVAATYSNIRVTLNNCTSNAQTETLVDPIPDVITSAKTDPTTCSGTDGTITISGVTTDSTYIVDYDSAGVSVSRTMVATAPGEIILTGLNSNSYTNIQVTWRGCTSNTVAETLADPATPTITSSKVDPTTCGGADGSITISGLTTGLTYDIAYDSNGTNVSFSALAVAPGEYTITGLPANLYENIFVTINGCGSDSTQETLNEPAGATITTTPTDPTSCGGTDGSILISGLTNGLTYDVFYDDDGTPMSLLGQVANVAGEITIPGLDAGSYTNIFVTLNGCPSNVETESLSDPGSPVIAISSTDPTTCSGTEGTITISGLIATNAYDVTYDDDGTPVTLLGEVANVSGQIILTGLNEGNYTGISVEIAGCISNSINDTLTGPAPDTITTAKVDPTTCNGTEGSITISGLVNGNTYTIDYDSLGTAVQFVAIADVSGEITITGLGEGAYTNITATENGCVTNAEDETLVGPTPPTISTTSTNPTTCGGSEGTITISGLANLTAYTVDYDSAGVSVSRSLTSDGSGQIIVTGLNAGTYNNITVTSDNCTSNAETEVLVDPSSPLISTTKTDPTTCGGSEGTITITGLVASTLYQIDYDSAGVSVSRNLTSDLAGEILITGLNAGAYTNIIATLNNCPSNAESETLIDPTGPTISTTSTNPTTCGGSEGTITITGLAFNTAYVIDYDSAGIAVNRSLTSDGAGVIVLTGLNAGTYANIIATASNCPSNAESETLSDPGTPAISTTKTDPTTCGGTDGTITISGLTASVTYQIDYDSLGTAVSVSLLSDLSGEIVLTGLGAGAYANITASLAGCTSNAESINLSDPGTPVISTTKTDPTACGGSDGTITIAGLVASTTYTINYDSAGVASVRVLTTDLLGEITLTGLNSVTYANITATLAGCTSNAENETLSDPGTPTITATKVDPTTCGGQDGSIAITGLLASTLYQIDYDSLGTLVSVNMTTDLAGEIVLSGLGAGAYTSITATSAGCTSNGQSLNLADPSAPVITTVKVDPTTCNGTEGSITIGGLLFNTAYVIDYDSLGSLVSVTLTSDGAGDILISGLTAGSYANITATLAGCTSNAETEVLLGPSPVTISTSKTDPTTCTGTDGTITISGLAFNTAYVINYDSAGVAVSRNMTSDGAGVVVLTGLNAAAYTNITATANGCTSNAESENLVDPSTPSISSTNSNPTSCGGTDGFITLSGLANTTLYVINYDSAGVAVSRNLTSDGAGQIVINGLVAGAYTNITATINGCTSNAENETLSDPGTPTIFTTKVDPTSCGGSDGSVTINGLTPSTAYLIAYDSVGTAVSVTLTTDLSGAIVLSGLSAGGYLNITASLSGCTSNAESETLSDPGTPTISTTKTDPTTCSGTDGRITITGLTPSTAYQIDYDSVGTLVSVSITSDINGEILLSGLSAGSYSNITATIAGCTSNAENVVLSDPGTPTISTTKVDPVTCGGSDGSITISGLSASTIYQIDYDSAGIAQSRSLSTDINGDIVLTGLNSTSYTNITASLAGCTSNAENETLSDPGTPSITIAKVDPTTCGGTDGSITISGLDPSTGYQIDYDSLGFAVSRSMTTDLAGDIVISGLGQGAYINFTATANGCTSNSESLNLVDPTTPVIATTKVDPTTCAGTDGSITISGLAASTTYQIGYDSVGTLVSTSLTADINGEILLSGLPEGSFVNITATLNGCTSNIESQVLVGPSAVIISTTKVDPSTCGGSDGSITITGLVASTTYQIDYDSAGVAVSRSMTSDVSGEILLSGLIAGTYANITATESGCTSNAETEVLADPTAPSISIAATDPTTCGGTDGTITIMGLTASTAYVINYDSAGIAMVKNLTSDLSGEILLVGLNSASYVNITATIDGCTSNAEARNLVDPGTPSITTSKVDPTTCGGTDGSITITGLDPSTAYLISYDSLGVATSATMTSDINGEILLSGLSQGAYTNIIATLNGCASNAENESLSDPNTPSILTSKSDPTTCSGTDGFITITGLDPNVSYVLAYDSLGIAVTGNVTSDINGEIVLSGLGQGSYTNINVTLNGCTSNSEAQVLSDPSTPSITSSKVDPITCGGTEGSITVSGLMAITLYVIDYDSAGVAVSRNLTTDVNGDIVISGLNQGTYSNITATLNNCTSNAETQTLVEPTVPVISTSKTDPTTCGGSEGTITISGLMASTAYSVSYDSAGINQVRALTSDINGDIILSGLNSVAYSNITVTINNCTSNAEAQQLFDPTVPVISTEKTDPLTCGGNEGTIIVRGLIPNTLYIINYDSAGVTFTLNLTSDLAGEAIITGLHEGLYDNITATLNNCVSNAEAENLIGPVPAMIGMTSTNPTTCGGIEGSFTITQLDSNKSYLVDYLDDGVAVQVTLTSDANGDITVSNLDEGSYTGITVTDNACVSNAVQATLVGPTPVTISSVPTNPSTCGGADGFITISGLDALTNYDLEITIDGVAQATQAITSDAFSSYEISGLSAGSYTDIAVTANNCVSNVVSETLVDPSAPVFVVTTVDPQRCGDNDGQLVFTGLNPASDYNITYVKDGVTVSLTGLLSDGTGQIIVPGLTEGTVASVTVERFLCSTTDGPFVLDAPDILPITISVAKDTICVDSSTTLSVDGVFLGSISWEDSNSAVVWSIINGQSGTSLTVNSDEALSPESYRAIVTYGLCTDTSNVLDVTTTKAIGGAVTVGDPDYICDGESTGLVLQGNLGNIQWQQWDGGPSWTDISGETNPGITVSPSAGVVPPESLPSLYRAVVTQGECIAWSDTGRVLVHPVPDLDVTIVGDNNLCQGLLAQFQMVYQLGEGSNPDYSWMVNGVHVAGGQNYNDDSLETGDVIKLTMISDSVCADPVSVSDSIVMNIIDRIEPDVTITLTPEIICEGDNFTFSIASEFAEGLSPSYQWLVNNAAIAETGSSFITADLVTGDSVQLIMTTSETCVTKPADTSNAIAIVVNENPVGGTISPLTDDLCHGELGTLNLVGHKGDVQWQWSRDRITWMDLAGETDDSLVTAPMLQVGTINNAVIQYYRVVVSLAPCGTDLSVHGTLVEYPEVQPIIDVTQDCEQIFADLIPVENGANEFLFWEVSTDSINFGEFNETGALYLTDDNLTEDTWYKGMFNVAGAPDRCKDSSIVKVDRCGPPPIDIPNALTPNGDSQNDVFWIRNIWWYPENTLRIYNRWGNLVYEAEGYNNYWDGTRNGKDLPDATYYYVLDLGDGSSEYQGTVTIFR